MIDPSEIKQRYTKRESATDAFGRVITVRRLNPAEQLRAAEMSSNDVAAQTIRFVCGLTGISDDSGSDDFSFPKSRSELDARLVRLDDEGLTALVEATAKIYGADTPKDGAVQSLPEKAKNS